MLPRSDNADEQGSSGGEGTPGDQGGDVEQHHWKWEDSPKHPCELAHRAVGTREHEQPNESHGSPGRREPRRNRSDALTIEAQTPPTTNVAHHPKASDAIA